MISKFQDDFFQDFVTKKNENVEKCCYTAKQHPHEWYMKDTNKDPQNRTQIMKFRADRAYNCGDFAMAVKIYSQLLEENSDILPSHMEREVMESVGRSYLKLGQFQEALSVAISMCQSSTRNKDHRTCSLMLLRKVYHVMKNYSNETLTCMELLQLHPLNMNLWGLFTESLTNLWHISLSDFGNDPRWLDEILTHVDPNCPFVLKNVSVKRICYILGCCFTRIRLIHSGINSKIKSDGLMKYSQWDQKAELWLKSLPLSSDFSEKASKMLCRDLVGEQSDVLEFRELRHNAVEGRNSNCEGITLEKSAVFRTNTNVFYARWFSWLESYNGS